MIGIVTQSLVLNFGFAAAPAQAALGDRLVMAINSVPYTQRQVELYITVKESLRKTDDGRVRTLTAKDWLDALQVFSEDMIILQESQRLGSFQIDGQLIQRYDVLVRKKIADSQALRDILLRLGADEVTVARTLEAVLRIAAFRRSKDRQEALGGDLNQNIGDSAALQRSQSSLSAIRPPSSLPEWLVELADRAIIRRYEGAEIYYIIQPTLGEAIDGL